MIQDYPNLMCFGRDINNCPLLGSCPDYKECEEKYKEDWVLLFDLIFGNKEEGDE